jgi:hypothetical protein
VAAYDITPTPSQRCPDSDSAVAAALRFSAPVALKASLPAPAHPGDIDMLLGPSSEAASCCCSATSSASLRRRRSGARGAARIGARQSRPGARLRDRRASAREPRRRAPDGGPGRRGRRRGPSRADQFLELVAERPGITVAEAAERLDASRQALYNVSARLQGEGRLRKDGRGFYPTEGSPQPGRVLGGSFSERLIQLLALRVIRVVELRSRPACWCTVWRCRHVRGRRIVIYGRARADDGPGCGAAGGGLASCLPTVALTVTGGRWS